MNLIPPLSIREAKKQNSSYPTPTKPATKTLILKYRGADKSLARPER
jgi:hypothetical protein